MNLSEVKDKIYDVASAFFSGAAVMWSEQINTVPPLPYVTLKVSGIRRAAFPVEDEDGERTYQCSTVLEVNLYTKGKELKSSVPNATVNYVNTATSDLMDFANYVESEGITDLLAENAMDISLMPPVRDLTELKNDSRYRYRAMAEFSVSFVGTANGRYGIHGNAEVPNSSGGGTAEMAAVMIEPIEDFEIVEEEVQDE